MHASEHDFYQLLIKLLASNYYVFPQIHIGSITKPRAGKNKDGSWSWWRHVRNISDQYSVDYVICDKQEISPQLVIELDDISHSTRKRINRDIMIERWLKEAKLDFLRISTQDAKKPELVENLIRAHLRVS